MSVTIDATVGGENANSYITLEDANTRFDQALAKERWYTFGDNQRTLALLEATTDIERLRLIGTPYDDDQALHFPRTTDVDDDGNLELPEGIIAATCHQALWQLEHTDAPPLLDRAELQQQGVRTISMDGISETYKEAGPEARFSVLAWDYLAPYVAKTGRIPTRS